MGRSMIFACLDNYLLLREEQGVLACIVSFVLERKKSMQTSHVRLSCARGEPACFLDHFGLPFFFRVDLLAAKLPDCHLLLPPAIAGRHIHHRLMTYANIQKIPCVRLAILRISI